jgi:hypothetical protein
MRTVQLSFHLSAWGFMGGQPLNVDPIGVRRSTCRTA